MLNKICSLHYLFNNLQKASSFRYLYLTTQFFTYTPWLDFLPFAIQECSNASAVAKCSYYLTKSWASVEMIKGPSSCWNPMAFYWRSPSRDILLQKVRGIQEMTIHRHNVMSRVTKK